MEQKADTARRQRVRAKSPLRQMEQKANTARRQRVRAQSPIRQLEQKADTARRQRVRAKSPLRQMEQKANTARRQRVRTQSPLRQKEQKADTARRQRVRAKSPVRRKEQQADTSRRRVKREDFNTIQKETEHERKRKRKIREDPLIREVERLKKKQQRTDRRYCIREKTSRKQRKQEKEVRKTIHDMIKEFKSAINVGCDYKCTCCSQLFFRHSVVASPQLKISLELRTKCNISASNSLEVFYLCHTCLSHLRKSKVPPLSAANNVKFPALPEELKVNRLEERLISPVNVFMQLRELPRGDQRSICGNVVNVPADNISTVNILPRRLDCTDTVPVKLKRRLRYKSHYMFENVRPEKCLQATRYLLTKELFRNFVSSGIDEDWLQTASSNSETIEPANEEVHECEDNAHTQDITAQSGEVDNESVLTYISSVTEHEVVNDSSQCIEHQTTEMEQNLDKSGSVSDDGNIQNTTNDNTTNDDNTTDEDAWTEDDDDAEMFSFGEMDTMLHPDITSAHYENTLNVAPSEGNVPISIFSDNVEELAFPTIFCGEKRPSNKERQVSVKYSDMCKSELRNSDRRAAANITNIFFKARKLQLKQIQDRVWLSVRRNKTKGKQYTAKDVRDKEIVENMVKLDEGFRIFRTLRGSPPYWESAKKDIFSMIRQLGLPTWFISLSAAETHWKPLLQCLYKISEGDTLSDDDIDAFTWTDKTKLISSDPVSVARYFDFRVQQFFLLFINSPLHPLGRVLDHFYRVEFQHRGSPHIHGLLWVDDSPKIDEVPDEELCNFVDNYVCTLRSEPLSKYQLHRHSHTCKKNKKAKAECRFNIPYPPLPNTMVIRPLVDENEVIMSKAQEDFQTIHSALKELGMGAEITVEEFLLSMDLTLDDYILAIRSSVSEPKIFMKRQPDAVRVNAFSPHIIKAWEANHDIQFVTDPYACAMYIVNYISKGQRGMSELLRKTCEEARQTGSDIRSQVRAIGNKFTRHSEMSAQEAVYITLQLPLRRCSRSFIFINTSPPEDRPFILKSDEQLKKLPDDSEDIAAENIISRYTQRPRSLNKLCLADFASWYDLNTAKKKDSKQNMDTPESDVEDNRDDDASADEQHTLNTQVTLQNGTSMRRRRTQKIIRFVKYNQKIDPENHFRELLMLFTPWRHEGVLIGESSSYEEQYMLVKEENDLKRLEYYSLGQDLEIEAVQEEDNEMFSNVAPSTQHRNDLDENNNTVREEEDQYINYDIGRDIGMSDQAGSDIREETIRNRVSDEQFRKDVRSLNTKQREFFDHALMKVKTTNEQLFLFLTGGAGVGKTKLTKTLYQALLRHYNSTAGDNPEQINILLTAPTGKAAFLIGGNTIHSAFSVPANQGFRYKSMVAEKLNSMRTKLGSLKFLFIDEISMCGANLFYYIDNRLRDIMQRHNVTFGGVSVLCIGDLFQLSPVRDRWIFRGASSVDDFGVLAPNVWVENIQMFELTEIMRQAEDKKFAQALNNVREGKHNNVDLHLLQSRLVPKTTMEDYSTTHIFYYNAAVQQHNITAFNNCTGQKAECNASDIVIGDVQHAVKIKVLQSAPTRAGDSMGLAKSLVIGVGLRVELTLNLDVEDGLVNGAAGVCKFITLNDNNIPKLIWILFDQEVLGKQRRIAMKHLYHIGIDRTWTSVSPVSRQFPVGKYKNVKVQRTQFPLQLAAGKTVHRSQGDTLDKIVVQLPDKRSAHMHYVALSRVTTLNGLKILNPFNPEKITVSEDVKAEMARLRETRTVTLCFTPLYTCHDVFSICFLNAQSLPLHIVDIKDDRNLMAADTLMLVETKLCSRDKPETFNIQYFDMHRYDHSHQRSAYGTVVYTRKEKVLVGNEKKIDSQIEIVYIHITQPLCTHVFSVYAKPNTNLTTIKKDITSALKDIDGLVIVMGDFNCEGHKREQLETYMETHGLQQKIHVPTTNSNTTLDLVFTNIWETDVGTLETYYSYHKTLFLTVPSSRT